MTEEQFMKMLTQQHGFMPTPCGHGVVNPETAPDSYVHVCPSCGLKFMLMTVDGGRVLLPLGAA